MDQDKNSPYINSYLTVTKQEENVKAKIHIFINKMQKNDKKKEFKDKIEPYKYDIEKYFLEKLKKSPAYLLHEILFPYILEEYHKYANLAEKEVQKNDPQAGEIENARNKLLNCQMELVKIFSTCLNHDNLTQLKFEEIIKPHLEFKENSNLKVEKKAKIDYETMWKKFSHAREKRKEKNPHLIKSIGAAETALNIPQGTLVPMMINDFIEQETWENVYDHGWDEFAFGLKEKNVLKINKNNPKKEEMEKKLAKLDNEIENLETLLLKNKNNEETSVAETYAKNDELLRKFKIQREELSEEIKDNNMCSEDCKTELVVFQLALQEQMFTSLYDYISVNNSFTQHFLNVTENFEKNLISYITTNGPLTEDTVKGLFNGWKMSTSDEDKEQLKNWENIYEHGWDEIALELKQKNVVKINKNNPEKEEMKKKLAKLDDDIENLETLLLKNEKEESAAETYAETKELLGTFKFQRENLSEKIKANYMCSEDCKPELVNFQLDLQKQMFTRLFAFINVNRNFSPLFLQITENFQKNLISYITTNGPLTEDKANELFKEWKRSISDADKKQLQTWQNANYYFDIMNILVASANKQSVFFSVPEILHYISVSKAIYENKVEVAWTNQLLNIESVLLNNIEAILNNKSISFNDKQVEVTKEVIKTLEAVKMINNCISLPTSKKMIDDLVVRVKIIATHWHEENYIINEINTNFPALSRRMLLSAKEKLIYKDDELKQKISTFYETLEANKKNVANLSTTCAEEIEKEYYFNFFFSDSEANMTRVMETLPKKIDFYNFIYSEKYKNKGKEGYGKEYTKPFFEVQLELVKERNYRVWTNLNTITNNLVEAIKNEEFLKLKAEVSANKKLAKINIISGNVVQMALAKLQEMVDTNSPYPEAIKSRARELHTLMGSVDTDKLSEEQNKHFHLIRKFIGMPHKELKPPTLQELSEISDYLKEKYPNFEIAINKIINALKSQHLLKQEGTGAPICLSGPPGIGKTKFVQDFANKLGWKFSKVSYSGLTNSESITGFPSTYVGSKPGCFVSKLVKIQPIQKQNFPNQLSKLPDENFDNLETFLIKLKMIENQEIDSIEEMCNEENLLNHVFLIDEVEKAVPIVQDASLDYMESEQRQNIICNYFDAPFDFNRCIFIATCNDENKIIPPLRSRFIMIQVPAPDDDHKFKLFNNLFETLLAKGVEVWEENNPNRSLTVAVTKEVREKIFENIISENAEEGVRIIINTVNTPVLSLMSKITEETKKEPFVQTVKIVVNDENMDYYMPSDDVDDEEKDETNIEGNSLNAEKKHCSKQETSKENNKEKIYNFLVPRVPAALAINSYELKNGNTFKTNVDNAIVDALTRTTSVTKRNVVASESKKMSKNEILQNIIWKSWATVAFDDGNNEYAKKFKMELDNMSKLQICLNPNTRQARFFDVDKLQIGLQQLQIKEEQANVLQDYSKDINKFFDKCYKHIYSFEQGQVISFEPIKDETPDQKSYRLIKEFALQIITSDEKMAQEVRSSTNEAVSTSKTETKGNTSGNSSSTSTYHYGQKSNTHTDGTSNQSTAICTSDSQTIVKHKIRSKNDWKKIFLSELKKERQAKKSDYQDLFTENHVKRKDVLRPEPDSKIYVSYQTAFDLIKVYWNHYKKVMDEYHVPIYMLVDQIQTTVLNNLNYLLECEKDFQNNICMYEVLELGINVLETLDEQLYKYEQTLNVLCGKFDDLMLKSKGKEVTIIEGRHHIANDAINLRDLFFDLVTKTNDCIIVFDDEKDTVNRECKVEKALSVHNDKKTYLYERMLKHINIKVININRKLKAIEQKKERKNTEAWLEINDNLKTLLKIKESFEENNNVKVILPPHIQSLMNNKNLIKMCNTSTKLRIKQNSPLILKRKPDPSDNRIAILPHDYKVETNVTKDFRKANRNIVNFTKEKKEINKIVANDNITCQNISAIPPLYTIEHGFDTTKNEDYSKENVLTKIATVEFHEKDTAYANPNEIILQGTPTDYEPINGNRTSKPFYEVSAVENRLEGFATVQKKITELEQERESVAECLAWGTVNLLTACF